MTPDRQVAPGPGPRCNAHDRCTTVEQEMLKSKRVHPDAFSVRPERRRRLRKGIRDERVCLTPDLVELVLRRLVDSSVKHVLLMGMLNNGMRAMLLESRELWILMLKR